MDVHELEQTLLRGRQLDRISLIDALEPTTNRDAWRIVAEHAYVGLDDGDPLKRAAGRFFQKCARLYAVNLSPSFHMVPWDSEQLLEEIEFTRIYAAVENLTSGFRDVTPQNLADVFRQEPRALVVFRMVAAYSRNQISFLLQKQFDIALSGDQLREIERKGTEVEPGLRDRWRAACQSLGELVYLAVKGQLLSFREGVETERFRPLTDKVDTREDWTSVRRVAAQGVAYSTLLYQRYIGSVFGQAINASTSLKADLLEGPVEKLLGERRISYYRVGAREQVPGWEQAPDFFVPGKDAPKVVIEAKVAEDGGTARDKASRIERLSRAAYARGITLISVVDGLGFHRINDVLAPILGNSKGLVFTHSNLEEILEVPALKALAGTTRT